MEVKGSNDRLDEEEAQNSKRDFTFTNLNLSHEN